MSAHNVLQSIYNAEYEIIDPGNAGVIVPSERSPCIVNLTSTGTETRTLRSPTKAGAIAILQMTRDGGNITVTAASGMDTFGNTEMLFQDVGSKIDLVATRIPGTTAPAYRWRVLNNDGVILS